ncbi:sensor histidine kinase [Butyrivibrio sp. VCB2006]|uniref:sensor histidine kinase n=1 Tax=Butyrivibrio sp. VCB2006 TaxID=1280679 RepID=UPI000492DD31|nr:ATP-binding protein [Butyrivibrio sp. VCB2006]
MNIKFSLFDLNKRFRYSLKQLVEFENSSDVKRQKCKTSIILLTGFIFYSLVATFFTSDSYMHGKVTNISLALFMVCICFLLKKAHRHTMISIYASFGMCTILFFHLIMEVDWTIGMDAFWLFILIMPFITNYLAGVVYGSISALSGLLLSILLFDTDLRGYLQPYGQNMVDWFPVIYVVVMIAAAITEYELTSYQIEKKISDEKISFFQRERTSRLREQLSIYESNELTIRKYKHDIRHFNRVLSGLLNDGEYEKAKHYLKEFDSMLEQVTTVSFCDNKIVNELLTIYTSRCNKLGFKLRAKASVPELFPMEEIELTSLLANALENALESQQKAPADKRYISVDISYDGRKLRLQTKNYCPEKIKFNKEGLPISTKAIQSGIGTHQIKSIATKYNGVASFSMDGEMFIVKAVMTCL